MPGKHLNVIERGKIELMREQGKSQADIAETLGRSESAISRELRRCPRGKAYCAQTAHKHYLAQRGACGRRPALEEPQRAAYVRDKLSDGLSPEQVAGRIKRDHPFDHRMRISHETIYRTIYSDPKWHSFNECLRRKHKTRRKRDCVYKRRTPIPNRVGIEKRPAEVDTLETDGHWEGDTIIGANQKGVIVTLVERKNDLLRAVHVASKNAGEVAKAILQALTDIPKQLLKTITFDNGTEFAAHELVSAERDVQIYFADPYSSWQRARNENMNGLIREYFPKKTSFEHLTQQEVDSVVNALNNRPRKKLGFRTPNEVWQELLTCT